MNNGSLAEHLVAFTQTYTYLVYSVMLLLFFCLLYLFNSRHRGPMLISGLFSVPFAFSSIMFVPEYWNPVRIAVLGAGPEDIMFSFSTGGIVWIFVVWFLRQGIVLRIRKKRFLVRYLAVCLSGSFWGTTLNFLGMPIMNATLVSIFLHGVALLLLRREYWKISAAGALVFTSFYTLFAVITLLIFPDFLLQWNLEKLSGLYIFNIPAEEIYWAFGFGAVWPLLMAYGFDAGLNRQMQTVETVSTEKATARPGDRVSRN